MANEIAKEVFESNINRTVLTMDISRKKSKQLVKNGVPEPTVPNFTWDSIGKEYEKSRSNISLRIVRHLVSVMGMLILAGVLGFLIFVLIVG